MTAQLTPPAFAIVKDGHHIDIWTCRDRILDARKFAEEGHSIGTMYDTG